MNWAAGYLVKLAMRASARTRLAQATKNLLARRPRKGYRDWVRQLDELEARRVAGLFGAPHIWRRLSEARPSTPLAAVLAAEKSPYVPEALATPLSRWRPGQRRLEPEVLDELVRHTARHYPPMNITQGLGSGLESGALLTAPSEALRRMTGAATREPLVFKYSVSHPLHRAVRKYQEAGGEMPPVWNLRAMLPKEKMDWALKRTPVWTWLEPKLEPATRLVHQTAMANRLKRVGLQPIDLYRQETSPAQIGFMLGAGGTPRLAPIDRGILTLPGIRPPWMDIKEALTGRTPYPWGYTQTPATSLKPPPTIGAGPLISDFPAPAGKTWQWADVSVPSPLVSPSGRQPPPWLQGLVGRII